MTSGPNAGRFGWVRSDIALTVAAAIMTENEQRCYLMTIVLINYGN